MVIGTAHDAHRADHSMAALSVVLVAASGWKSITRTLQHLRAQTVREQMEIVVVCEEHLVDTDDARDHPFHTLRVVHTPPVTRRGAAAALGMASATAPLVGLLEDHSFPAPTWGANLIEAHEGPWAGVGPTVGNANPASAISWVNYLLTYGSLAPGIQGGVQDLIPWHNSTYKRAALASLRADLPRLLEWEGLLQARLLANGELLYLAAGARTDHLNVSRLRSAMGLNLSRGRIMGATRADEEGWSLLRRVAYACAFPIYPLFQMRRLLPMLRKFGLAPAFETRVVASMIPVLLVMAIGEAAGVLRGVGPSLETLEDYELHRFRHLAASDRTSMFSRDDSMTEQATGTVRVSAGRA